MKYVFFIPFFALAACVSQEGFDETYSEWTAPRTYPGGINLVSNISGDPGSTTRQSFVVSCPSRKYLIFDSNDHNAVDRIVNDHVFGPVKYSFDEVLTAIQAKFPQSRRGHFDQGGPIETHLCSSFES